MLCKYAYNLWFGTLGQKIAKDHHAKGVSQRSDDLKLLHAYRESEDVTTCSTTTRPRSLPSTVKSEMRVTYMEFTERLVTARSPAMS